MYAKLELCHAPNVKSIEIPNGVLLVRSSKLFHKSVQVKLGSEF